MEKLMTTAIQLLRESFDKTQRKHEEQWYGLTTEACDIRTYHPHRRGVRILTPAVNIVWRNYQSGDEGDLAMVRASEVVPILTELFEELQRLRSLRLLQVAA
jgi:hypothetical protein